MANDFARITAFEWQNAWGIVMNQKFLDCSSAVAARSSQKPSVRKKKKKGPGREGCVEMQSKQGKKSKWD